MRPQPVGAPTHKTDAVSRERNYASCTAIALTVLLGILVASSTTYGVHRFYSSIPFWDEWDGYIGFYRQVSETGSFHWWIAQHNEHRILTSRLLFWLDIHYFSGAHILLLGAILAFLAGIVALVTAASKNVSKAWVIGSGAMLMFSWTQHELLTWGFEVQVVASFFFIALACFFFCQFRWSTGVRFTAAYGAAILAEFSMANGLGAYAIFLGAAFFARRPTSEKVATAIFGSILTAVYFIGYVSPGTVDPVAGMDGITEKLQFFALVMANPLAVAGLPVLACIVVGAATTVVGVVIAWRIYWTRTATPYRTFLVCLFVFALLSALAVTKGRAMGGLGLALASRYATGPLIGWWVLALLAFDYFSRPIAKSTVICLSLILGAAVAAGQPAIMADNGYLYKWKLAVLSNRIGVKRKDLTSQIFPQDPGRAERFESNAEYAATHHIAVYSEQWLRDASQVKFDPSKLETGWCAGNLESVKSDAQDPTASGWAASPAGDDALIVLTDAQGQTVGYGVTGIAREDVSKAVPGAPKLPGWNGFAQPGKRVANGYVYANERFCKLSSIDR